MPKFDKTQWEKERTQREIVLHIRIKKTLLARIDQKAAMEGMTRKELLLAVLEDVPMWIRPEWRLTKDQFFRKHDPATTRANQVAFPRDEPDDG